MAYALKSRKITFFGFMKLMLYIYHYFTLSFKLPGAAAPGKNPKEIQYTARRWGRRKIGVENYRQI